MRRQIARLDAWAQKLADNARTLTPSEVDGVRARWLVIGVVAGLVLAYAGR